MPWNMETTQFYRQRTKLLKTDVLVWLENIGTINPQWEGPSLYFHKVLIKTADEIQNTQERAADNSFIERLYACLVSWGIHRFDNPNARLVDYFEFKREVIRSCTDLNEFSQLRLQELSETDLNAVSNRFKLEIDNFHIVVAEWPLVANSKLLHHIFPHLIPPIDRKYTLKYFINRENDDRNPPSYAFGNIFKSFWKVATANADQLHQRCVDTWQLPLAWNTTIPKLIDNALVASF